MTTKTEELLKRLTEGWNDAPVLMARFGWGTHTLRGAISTLAKKHGLKIERQRIDGVTSYRVAPVEYSGIDDFAKSREVGFQAIKDRMAAGGPPWVPGEGK